MHVFNNKKRSSIYKFIFFKKKNFFHNSSFYLHNFFFKETQGLYSNNTTRDLIFKKGSLFLEENKNINNFSSEISVNRIRFKPGYQRL